MGVSLTTVFFWLISVIVLGIVALSFFEQPRGPQCSRQEGQTTLLPCVSDLLLELRNNAINFEPLTYEFLVRYFKSLTVEQQDLFYRTPVEKEEGFYLRTSSEVLRRLNQNPTCVLNHTLPSVAVCVQQHSVGQYMQEWIAHYLLLGASKVVVYDNSNPHSTESRYFRRVVQPFVEAGFVDIVPWFFETGPDLFRPAEAFMDCYSRYKDQFDWIGNFDSDEFLVIHPPLPPCLPAVTQHYSRYGGIAVNWRLVTPVGSLDRNSSALLFEQYLWVISDGLRHVKTIYQTKFTSGIDSAHCARYVPGKHVVSPGLHTPSCPFNNITSESTLYELMELRHFYGRDLSFFAFDKVCSRTVPGQITYSKIRAQMLIAMLTTKHLSRLPDEGPHASRLRAFLLA